jgi:hypothetical protein
MGGRIKRNKWGGKREGSGRKSSGLGETVVMRVPEFLKKQVKDFINNKIPRGDSPTEKIEIPCGDSRLEQIETIISDWRRVRPTHSPSYKNVDKLLSELEAVFSEETQAE